MNILDEPFKEEANSKPPRWLGYLPQKEWKGYLKFIIIAGGLLLYLFMRSSSGSDFDAVLVLLLLGLIFIVFLPKQSRYLGTISIPLSCLLFYIFLTYIPEAIEFIHPSYSATEWRWSHFELLFREDRTLYNTITEWLEWLLVYSFLALFPIETARIWNHHRSSLTLKK